MTEVAVAASQAPEKRMAAALQHRFFLRLHMTAMLALTLLAGLFTVRLLAAIGVSILFIRYAVAVVVAYAVFVSSVKLWLWYVGICAAAAARRSASSAKGSDWFDCLNLSSSGSSTSSSSSSFSLDEGGGRFGGGGATGSWGSAVFSSKSSSGSSSKGGDSDLGELMVVVLIIALVVVVIAAFAWVIYAAPTILSEAAFNAVLAGALAKHAHKASHGSWVGSVVRATRIPFGIILALAILLGWYAQHYCPDATRLTDALHCARPAN